jgi:hypothetical protein
MLLKTAGIFLAGAKLAKKGHIISFQNQDLKISFAAFA